MEKKEVEKKTGIKRFSICLMNPPYGDRGGTIHLDFVNKCMKHCKKQIVIMPFGFVNKDNKAYIKFKNELSKYLTTVEELNFDCFDGASATIKSLGIYTFDINQSADIKINFIDGTTKTLKHLLDYTNFSDYEKNIINILYNHKCIDLIWAGGHDHVTEKSLNKQGVFDKDEIKKLIKEEVYKNCNKLQCFINENKDYAFITLNNHTGLGAAKYIAAEGGKIFNNGQNLISYLLDVCKPSGYIIVPFKNEKCANNFKVAIQNPLLRFCLLRVQKDHNMIEKYFKHIPNDIDWENDKVKTDEGLLEICGCPKEKCKEYADYCKKMINKVDNGEKV